MRPVNICIIGGGYWGSTIGEKIEELSNNYGLVLCFMAGRNDDYISLCRQHGIDWALVAVPTSQHRSIVEQLLDDGRNVFCTKPLTENTAYSSYLIDLAKKHGCRFYIDDVFTYNHNFAALQAETGKNIRILWHKSKGREFDSVADVLFRLLYHDLYLIRELIGEQSLRVLECEINRRAFYLRAECGGGVLEVDYRIDSNAREEHKINGVDFTHQEGQCDPLQQMLLTVLVGEFDQKINNARGLWCNLRIDELLDQMI